MPRRYTGLLPTLHDGVASGLVISTYCNACLTAGRQIEAEVLVALLGWEATKDDIERRLRCTRCGARKGTIQVGLRRMPFTSRW
jgi:hypothetical protein